MNRDEIILIASQCGDWNGQTCEMDDAGLMAFAEHVLAANSDGRNSKSWRTIARGNLEGMAKCREQLAESQAREAKLREALTYAQRATCLAADDAPDSPIGKLYAVVSLALTLPSDNTALRKLVAKAGEVMRERCDTAVLYEHGLDCQAEAIRDLPIVTLEDLK